MSVSSLLTPSEVAGLAGTSKTVVEKALEQNIFAATPKEKTCVRASIRMLPLYAVALVATSKAMGRRLTVSDKKLMARELAGLTSSGLKSAEVEITLACVVRVGQVAGVALENAERYIAARDAFIERRDGVQGGRALIKGTRITVSAVYGRMLSGDRVEDLIDDYPDIPRDAFETAFLYAQMHPQIGRPLRRASGVS